MFFNNEALKNCGNKKISTLWDYIIFGILIFTIFIAEIALYIFSNGITMLISHIFYFPLFFLVFSYPKKGITISISLGIVYLVIIYLISYSDIYNLSAGILFFFAYICIGTGISVLAGKIRTGEVKLRQFKKNYRSLFENTIDSVFVHNMAGEILVCNNHAGKLFGVDNLQVGGMTLADLDFMFETSVFEELNESVIREGRVTKEASLAVPSGEKIYVEINSSITDSEKGYVHVFLRDITERKKALFALEESENRLSVLTNQIPEMIFELDSSGSITFATRYSLNMFGYEPDELTNGMKFWDLLAESEQERAKGILDRFLSGNIICESEYAGKKKDGTVFQIMINMSYIFSKYEIKGLRGIAIDISQRKEMENAIKNSEKKYRSLFENSNDAVVIHTLEGNILDVNESLKLMLGYNSRDTFLNARLYDFFSDSVHESVAKMFSDLKTRKNLYFESELLKKDGGVVIVEVSSSLVSSGRGLVQTVVRDITDKKKAREALIESEKKFRNLTDLLPQIVFEIDRSGVVTFANKNAFESFRVNYEDFLKGIYFWDVIAPEDRERAKENFQWMLSGYDSRIAYEYVALRSDGTKFSVLIYISLIRKGGVVTGARGIGIDISGRKKMEEALLVSEERLKLAIQGAGVCVWDWDMNDDQMYFAGNYREMFGYLPGDINAGQSGWREILQVQFFSDVMEFFTDIIDVEETGFDPESHHFNSEYHMKCKDGTYKWISVMGKIAEWDDDGIPLRIVGIMQDITQIKQYQDAIYEANRKLNLLSSITRHDILNQIAGINGFTDLLYRKVSGNEELVHHLDRIKQASGNIKEQITFTRDYHNVGVESPHWQRVDEIANKVKSKAKNMGVSFDVNCGPLEVYADPMLEKIFFNLIDNAVRHGKTVTCIDLSFKKNLEKGVIVIRDNGVGVSDKLKSRIFDHGFGNNTGLGLFLTKEILSITGLDIAETGVYGEGAIFEITMPPENYRFAKENSD